MGNIIIYKWCWLRKIPKLLPFFPKKMLHDFCQKHRFSPREKRLLALAIAGKQRKEMAQILGLSIDTVKEYLGTAYRKAEVDGKAALPAKVLSKISMRS